MIKLIIFLGPPGSGKGSISQLCADRLGAVQISTGYLCRKHILQNTPIGKQIDFSIKSGILIPDELIMAMVEESLKECQDEGKPVILDGFPRTRSQALALQGWLDRTRDLYKPMVIRFVVPDDVVLDRIAHRYVCMNSDCQRVYTGRDGLGNSCTVCGGSLMRRSDDGHATAVGRLRLYRKVEADLLDFYIHSGCYAGEIAVDRPMEDVYADVAKLVLGS